VREEHRFKVFKKGKGVKIRIFGVTGEWRRLRNKELYALYSSQNIILVIKSRKM
jgi:hypothetical protein